MTKNAIIFFISIFLCTSCVFYNQKYESLRINKVENIIVNNKNVTLIYNSETQLNGFKISFSNVCDLTCKDVSLITTSAFGFISNNEQFLPFPIETQMPQYHCEKKMNQIFLTAAPPLQAKGFRPWVGDFNIQIGPKKFFFTVNSEISQDQLLTRNTQENMFLNSSFNGCGLQGTILQRVFDCSKSIINYSVTVDDENALSNSSITNSDGTSLYYTLFTNPNVQNPDLFWFVVSCPSGNGGTIPQQRCAWLSPIVPAGNPALDTANVKLFTLDLITGYQKRLLFSGKMDDEFNGYDFANVNGFTNMQAFLYEGSPSTINPGNGGVGTAPTISPASVCSASAGQALNSATSVKAFNPIDAATRDIISVSSGATILWFVPSYPILNIITGGTPSNTLAFPGTCPNNGRPSCNMAPMSAINQGFNAVNVPGFFQSEVEPVLTFEEFLWTSSRNGVNPWSFFPLLNMGGGDLLEVAPDTIFMGARCVSTTWY